MTKTFLNVVDFTHEIRHVSRTGLQIVFVDDCNSWRRDNTEALERPWCVQAVKQVNDKFNVALLQQSDVLVVDD